MTDYLFLFGRYINLEVFSRRRHFLCRNLAFMLVSQVPVDRANFFRICIPFSHFTILGLIQDETKHVFMSDVRFN